MRLEADHEAWNHVRLATEMCREEFDVADDGREAAVWLGDRPETVFEEHLDRHNNLPRSRLRSLAAYVFGVP